MIDRDGHTKHVAIPNQAKSPSSRDEIDGALLLTPQQASQIMFPANRFEQVYTYHARAGWWAITADLQWLPIGGMPNEHALAHIDPGYGAMLLGTKTGVYAIQANGLAERLGGVEAPSHAIRSFVRIGDTVIAGGDDGLFAISPSNRITQVPYGDAEHIGIVLGIVELGFAGLAVVQASNGTFAYEAGGLRRIPDLSSVTGKFRLMPFPELGRVLWTYGFLNPSLLFDLARRDAGGACSLTLTSSH